MKGAGIYAGMDCCCRAGSIAISNEIPPSLDIGIEHEFRWRTIRGRLRSRLGGRLFRLHRIVPGGGSGSGPSFGCGHDSPHVGVPTIGHFGNSRRSPPAAKRRGDAQSNTQVMVPQGYQAPGGGILRALYVCLIFRRRSVETRVLLEVLMP